MTTRTDVVVTELRLKTNQLQRELAKTNRALGQINKSVNSVQKSFRSFGTALKGALIGGAAAKFAKDITASTIAVDALDTRLRNVTKTSVEFGRAFSYLQGTAEELGMEMSVLQDAYIKFYANTQAVGMSTGAGEAVFTAIATSAKAAGLSVAELDGVLLGLNQIVNSSSLSLEDMRQVADRLPGGTRLWLDAINELTGGIAKNDTETKKLISAGKILTKDILPIVAKRAMEANKQLADKSAESYASAVARLSNAFDDLLRVLANSGLINALTEFVNLAGRLVTLTETLSRGGGLTEAMFGFQGGASAVVGDLTSVNARLIDVNESIAVLEGGGGVTGWLTRAGLTDAEAAKQLDYLRDVRTELTKLKALLPEVAFQMRNKAGAAAGSASSSSTPSVAGTAGSAAAVRLAEQQEKAFLNSLQSIAQLENAQNRELIIKRKLLAVDESQRDVLEKRLELATSIADLSVSAIGQLDKKDPMYGDRKGIVQQEVNAAADRMQARGEELNALNELEESYQEVKAVADEFGTAVAEGFASIITGAESANDALANILDSLAAMVIQMTVIKPLAEAISTGITGDKPGGGIAGAITKALGFANGGVVSTGLPQGVYSAPTPFPINGPSGRFAMGTGLLGEAGPEAVLPLSRGPGGKLGVTAEGSGQAPSVTIINNAPGVDVSAQQGLRPQDLEIVVAKVSSDITRGGSSISRSIEGTYALKRGRAAQ